MKKKIIHIIFLSIITISYLTTFILINSEYKLFIYFPKHIISIKKNIIFPLFVFIMYITLNFKLKNTYIKKIKIFLLFLMIFHFLFQISIFTIHYNKNILPLKKATLSISEVIVNPHNTGYYHDAKNYENSILKYLKRYSTLQWNFENNTSELSLPHSPQHPPGKTLIFYSLIKIFQKINLKNFILIILNKTNLLNTPSLLEIEIFLLGISLMVISSLTVPLFYLILKECNLNKTICYNALNIYILLPSLIIFSVTADKIMLFFTFLWLYFFIKTIKNKRFINIFISVVLLNWLVIISFISGILIVCVIISAIFYIIYSYKNILYLLKLLLYYITFSLIIQFLLYITLNINIFNIFFNANYVQNYLFNEMNINPNHLFIYSFFEFFNFLGIFTFIFLFYFSFLLKKPIYKSVFWGTNITLIIFFLYGKPGFELPRNTMFLYPFFIVFYSVLLDQIPNKKLSYFYYNINILLIFIQIIVLKKYFVFYGY